MPVDISHVSHRLAEIPVSGVNHLHTTTQI